MQLAVNMSIMGKLTLIHRWDHEHEPRYRRHEFNEPYVTRGRQWAPDHHRDHEKSMHQRFLKNPRKPRVSE